MTVFRHYILNGLTCTLYIFKKVGKVNYMDFKGLRDSLELEKLFQYHLPHRRKHTAYMLYNNIAYSTRTYAMPCKAYRVWLKEVEPKHLYVLQSPVFLVTLCSYWHSKASWRRKTKWRYIESWSKKLTISCVK